MAPGHDVALLICATVQSLAPRRKPSSINLTGAEPIRLDVTRPEEIVSAVQKIKRRFGRIACQHAVLGAKVLTQVALDQALELAVSGSRRSGVRHGRRDIPQVKQGLSAEPGIYIQYRPQPAYEDGKNKPCGPGDHHEDHHSS